MPDALTPVPFTLQMLFVMQEFECGDNPWDREVSDWIKGVEMQDGLRSSLDRGTKVWLYVNANRDVVGFSSLGTSKWGIPKLKDPRRNVGIIPNVAVRSRFQGLPVGP